eukprot:TRINITY_DN21581_c0_g1_i1.p1 TRINITY_DN21581_c0_g1~~TRINITY_DN21581_c0_g1_i1.p1  ORF type:complete len:508 (+),score=17.67 TRINITY_DN21581_c0_g1_i1:65-1525(+)
MSSTSHGGASPPQAEYALMASKSHWKRLISEFYKVYNPAKLADVPKILEEYDGDEAQLFQDLIEKYTPGGERTLKQPASQLSTTHDYIGGSEFTEGAATASSVPGLQRPVLSTTSSSPTPVKVGRPRAATAKPTDVHPSAATESLSVFSDSVYAQAGGRVAGRVLMSGDRSSLVLPPVLSPGLQQRVERLRRAHPGASDNDLFVTAVHQQRTWRNAIISFYQRHQPEKLGNIHEIFAECNGEEEMLYEILEAKYLHNVPYPAEKPPQAAAEKETLVHSSTQVVQPSAERGTQCDAKRGITVSTAPLTQSMEITGGELVALEDVGDQIEWSLLVVLEQEERVRRLMCGLLVDNAERSDSVARLCKAASDRLDGIHTDTAALRLIFDKYFSESSTEAPSVDIAPPFGLPTPIALESLYHARHARDDSPPVSPPPYPPPRHGTSVSQSTGRMSPPAPLPHVSTAALLEAVSTLQRKGVNLPVAFTGPVV